MKATWTVVVVYENAKARERAVGFCDCLVQKFWTRCGFDVSWWSFDLLAEEAARTAAEIKAAVADLVIFASLSQGLLPTHLSSWMEHCIQMRGEREGALLYLSSPDGGPAGETPLYLRHAAHRAGMDFLTEMPQNLESLIPESPDFYSARAHQGSDVLAGILRQSLPPR